MMIKLDTAKVAGLKKHKERTGHDEKHYYVPKSASMKQMKYNHLKKLKNYF